MIISHKYRFIFIKTRKTAGTSLEVFLSQHCGDADVVTPIYPHVEPHRARNFEGRWNLLSELGHFRDVGRLLKDWLRRRKFYNHIPARNVKRRIPQEIWDDYFKFCVERNPWDKTLSHYFMRRDMAKGDLTFDQYLADRDFCWNTEKYLDYDGRLLVDQVMRYERLREELGNFFGRIGIPFHGDLGVRAKSEHRKDRRPYSEVYTEAQRKVVEEAFATEIRMHGYRF